jgi:hypothetical protein
MLEVHLNKGICSTLCRMPNPVSPQMRDFAERLFADEATAGTLSQVGKPMAFRVCEKLRRPLTTFAGAVGYRSLLLRALTLAKREAPSLSAVKVNPDGSLEDDDGEPNLGNHDAEGGVLLVAHLLGLLFAFIGETLTLRLMQDVWPDGSFNGLTAEGMRKNEPQG